MKVEGPINQFIGAFCGLGDAVRERIRKKEKVGEERQK